ncbi:MAG TPA: protein kinase, partial [Polyangiaceae bacterium]|nr:protein kinase [Polyangiaceae bacterium]
EVVTDGEPFTHGEASPQHIYIDEHGTARLVPLLNSHFTGTANVEQTGYVAPERLAGEPFDARADIFSVGVMLWEALAGKRLFPKTSLEAVRARLAEPLEPTLNERERWARPLCAIALRAIAEDPSERFQTAMDLSHAMATAVAAQLSHVDVDAWREEAPTPVFQPRLHLVKLRTPPPLPQVSSPTPLPGSFDTAPPTTSSDAPAPALAPSRASLYLRRGVLVATLTTLAAAAGWFGAPRLPRSWQRLMTGPGASAQSLAIRAAAQPPRTTTAPVALPPPSAAPTSPGSASSTIDVPPTTVGRAPTRSALAPSAQPATKPKTKALRVDYGI